MDTLVRFALVLDVTLDDIFVGILSHGVHVVAARPEIASPEHLLNLRMGLEDMFGCEAFDDLGDFCGREGGNTLDEEVDVIEIRPDFDEAKFVALLNLKTDLFECLFHRLRQGFFPVFHRTNQVIEQKRLVMAFGDVFTHPLMLHLGES